MLLAWYCIVFLSTENICEYKLSKTWYHNSHGCKFLFVISWITNYKEYLHIYIPEYLWIYFNQLIISIISVDCVLSLYIKVRLNISFWCAFGILCLYYADNVILGTHVEPSCFVFLCATITLWLRYITIDFYYLYRKHLRPMLIV